LFGAQFTAHVGVAHTPFTHVLSPVQVPQLPPHPSGPHPFDGHAGKHDASAATSSPEASEDEDVDESGESFASGRASAALAPSIARTSGEASKAIAPLSLAACADAGLVDEPHAGNAATPVHARTAIASRAFMGCA
jgi:hypothetical protein